MGSYMENYMTEQRFEKFLDMMPLSTVKSLGRSILLKDAYENDSIREDEELNVLAGIEGYVRLHEVLPDLIEAYNRQDIQWVTYIVELQVFMKEKLYEIYGNGKEVFLWKNANEIELRRFYIFFYEDPELIKLRETRISVAKAVLRPIQVFEGFWCWYCEEVSGKVIKSNVLCPEKAEKIQIRLRGSSCIELMIPESEGQEDES